MVFFHEQRPRWGILFGANSHDGWDLQSMALDGVIETRAHTTPNQITRDFSFSLDNRSSSLSWPHTRLELNWGFEGIDWH